MTNTKPCLQCGNPLERDPRISSEQWEYRKYCSAGCTDAARRTGTRDPLGAGGVEAFEASVLMDGPSVDETLKRVAKHFRCTVADLRGKDRHKHIARARQVAYWALRRLKLSFPEIARELGDRNHTTVMSGVRKVEAARAASARVAELLDVLVEEERGAA